MKDKKIRVEGGSRGHGRGTHRGVAMMVWGLVVLGGGIGDGLSGGLSGGVVWGQQMKTDGRRMDANLQSGSGGYNQPAAQEDYRARNNLITGNTTGLDYFHGDVGYRASGEFTGRSSSDALFRFNARSMSGTEGGWVSPYATGAGQMSRLLSPGGQGVYRNMAPTLAGDVAISRANLLMTSSGLLVRGPEEGTGLSGFNLLGQRSQATARLGGNMLVSLKAERAQSMSVSPLMGVRTMEEGDYVTMLSSAAWRGSPSGAGVQDARKFDASKMQTGTGAHPGLMGHTGVPLGVVLGAQLQAMMEPGKQEGVSGKTLNQKLEEIEAAMFSPLGTGQAKAGDDVYMDILTRISGNAKKARGEKATGDRLVGSGDGLAKPMGGAEAGGREDQTGVLGGPADTLMGKMGSKMGEGMVGVDGKGGEESGKAEGQAGVGTAADFLATAGLMTAGQQALGRPTAQQLAKAREDSDVAMRKARGLLVEEKAERNDGGSSDSESGGVEMKEPKSPVGSWPEKKKEDGKDGRSWLGYGGEGGKEGQRKWKAGEVRRPVEELMDSIRYVGPGLQSLAGKRDDLVNNLMREGEKKLSEGLYFEAEDAYRDVLDIVPGHPMAEVGKLHAQLGGGMIRSAARSLRLILEVHPELAGVRYQPQLLPPAGRLVWVRKQLDEILKYSKDSDTDAPLLLAYLGFQFEMPELTEYGLKMARARDPYDVLLGVLERLWLKQDGAGAGATTQP